MRQMLTDEEYYKKVPRKRILGGGVSLFFAIYYHKHILFARNSLFFVCFDIIFKSKRILDPL